MLDNQTEALDHPEVVLQVTCVVRATAAQGNQALDHSLHRLDLIGP